jgi:putative DNA primase/helicase
MPLSERPVPPALPTAAQVPPELRPLKRWCAWQARWDEAKGKWRKPPFSPVTGEGVGPVSKNAEHFLDFDAALAGSKHHHLDGVGFVFLREDGYCGVDFDDCRKDGIIHPEVVTWLRWFPSYKEVSVSGTGVHVIGRGKLIKALGATPLSKDSGITCEAYAWDRYFTFSGIALDL